MYLEIINPLINFLSSMSEQELNKSTINLCSNDLILCKNEIIKVIGNRSLEDKNIQLFNSGIEAASSTYQNGTKIDSKKLNDLYSNSNTLIRISDVDKFLPSLNGLKHFLSHHLLAELHMNLYQSKKKSDGLREHEDKYDILVFQLIGSKNWIINEKKLQLCEGDIIFLPAGTKHIACTQEKESYHLTCGIHYLSALTAAKLTSRIKSIHKTNSKLQIWNHYLATISMNRITDKKVKYSNNKTYQRNLRGLLKLDIENRTHLLCEGDFIDCETLLDIDFNQHEIISAEILEKHIESSKIIKNILEFLLKKDIYIMKKLYIVSPFFNVTKKENDYYFLWNEITSVVLPGDSLSYDNNNNIYIFKANNVKNISLLKNLRDQKVIISEEENNNLFHIKFSQLETKLKPIKIMTLGNIQYSQGVSAVLLRSSLLIVHGNQNLVRLTSFLKRYTNYAILPPSNGQVDEVTSRINLNSISKLSLNFSDEDTVLCINLSDGKQLHENLTANIFKNKILNPVESIDLSTNEIETVLLKSKTKRIKDLKQPLIISSGASDKNDALDKSYFEFIERSSLIITDTSRLVFGSRANLENTLPPEDFSTLANYSGAYLYRPEKEVTLNSWTEHEEVYWIQVKSILGNTNHLLPAQLICSLLNIKEKNYFFNTSVGTACGESIDDAIERGILELIERDAVGTWWYKKTKQYILNTERKYQVKKDREMYFLKLPSSFTIPVIVCVTYDKLDNNHICIGTAAAYKTEDAELKAYNEMMQFSMNLKSKNNYYNKIFELSIENDFNFLDKNVLTSIDEDKLNDKLNINDILNNFKDLKYKLYSIDLSRSEFDYPVTRVICPNLRSTIMLPSDLNPIPYYF